MTQGVARNTTCRVASREAARQTPWGELHLMTRCMRMRFHHSCCCCCCCCHGSAPRLAVLALWTAAALPATQLALQRPPARTQKQGQGRQDGQVLRLAHRPLRLCF